MSNARGGERLLSVIRGYHEKKGDPVTLKAVLERKSRGDVQGGWRERGGKKARCGGMEKEKG